MRGTVSCVGYLAHSFDLINVHDLDLIAQARQHCSRLVVGVYSDEFVLASTGRQPVIPLVERLALVSHVRGVDEAIVHGTDAAPSGPDVVIFVERAREPGDEARDPQPVVRLEAPRESESAVLRHALQPLGEAVA
ncbi:hypothetical protein [Microlunatus ginsengisoli]|uniref:Cytidyltransferase-like domain-containing protein n=1 Tax=Microlunatus ginsengisoli TaxID=363863 RepID=A0ABP6ZGZ4_9ACTN